MALTGHFFIANIKTNICLLLKGMTNMPQINLFFWLILILAAMAIYMILVENDKAEAEIRKQGKLALHRRQMVNRPQIRSRSNEADSQAKHRHSACFLEVGETDPISSKATYDFTLPPSRLIRTESVHKQSDSGNCHICA